MTAVSIGARCGPPIWSFKQNGQLTLGGGDYIGADSLADAIERYKMDHPDPRDIGVSHLEQASFTLGYEIGRAVS